FGEQQMRFIEEEYKLGLVEVTHFRQMLKQFRQHPQQESRIQARRVHQLVRRQYVDHSFTVGIGLQQIFDVEHGFAEEAVTTLLIHRNQTTLNSTDTRSGNIAVFGFEIGSVVTDILQHRTQILAIQQQHALIICDLESQL